MVATPQSIHQPLHFPTKHGPICLPRPPLLAQPSCLPVDPTEQRWPAHTHRHTRTLPHPTRATGRTGGHPPGHPHSPTIPPRMAGAPQRPTTSSLDIQRPIASAPFPPLHELTQAPQHPRSNSQRTRPGAGPTSNCRDQHHTSTRSATTCSASQTTGH